MFISTGRWRSSKEQSRDREIKLISKYKHNFCFKFCLNLILLHILGFQFETVIKLVKSNNQNIKIFLFFFYSHQVNFYLGLVPSTILSLYTFSNTYVAIWTQCCYLKVHLLHKFSYPSSYTKQNSQLMFVMFSCGLQG